MARRTMKVEYFAWSARTAPLAGPEILAEPTPGTFRWNLAELKQIGKGTTRRVYDLGDGTVLKTCLRARDAHRCGYCPCEAEGRKWNSLEDSHRPYFARVLESGPCWVRMEKADSVPVECLNGCPGGMPYGASWYRRCEDTIREIYVHDIHPGQFGIFAGEYKLLDYGI